MKIIATSGLKASSKTADVARLGVSTLLQKPYTAEALLKALAVELNKQ
jgi:hypothetical protein